jgi:hypothetical protein
VTVEVSMTAHNHSVLPLALTFLVALSPQRLLGAGGEWTHTGPARGGIRALVIDPTNPATVYAGTSGGGVFKSSDSGGTWSAVNTGHSSLYVLTPNASAGEPDADANADAGHVHAHTDPSAGERDADANLDTGCADGNPHTDAGARSVGLLTCRVSWAVTWGDY